MAKPIGFIGIGQMGRPMVERLAGAGLAVLIHDRRAEALAPLAGVPGVSPAATAAQLAQACDAIILMLPDSSIVDALLWTKRFRGQLAQGQPADRHGLVQPNATRANQSKLAEMGIALVDAPVSGGVRRAVDGSLAIMVGGASADVERSAAAAAADGQEHRAGRSAGRRPCGQGAKQLRVGRRPGRGLRGIGCRREIRHRSVGGQPDGLQRLDRAQQHHRRRRSSSSCCPGNSTRVSRRR